MSKYIRFTAGDIVSVGDAIYNVMEGNSNTSSLVGISYERSDGVRTNIRYIDWSLLTLVPTVDYSAAVREQY